MRSLPMSKVQAWERWLAKRWFGGEWHTRRGAIACSLGMLGLRWCEVERSEVRDHDVGSGLLYVRTGKRGLPRSIEAPPGLLRAALEMRGEVRSTSDRVFVTKAGRPMVYSDQRRFTARATVAVFGRDFSFHCFRHTAACRVWDRTHDVLAVQRFLGHRSLAWTNAYLKSIRVVEVGGPVAFCGGSSVGPRLFDPDGQVAAKAAEVKEERGGPGLAAVQAKMEEEMRAAFEREERRATSMVEAFKAKAAEVKEEPGGPGLAATQAKMMGEMRAAFEREEAKRAAGIEAAKKRAASEKWGHRTSARTVRIVEAERRRKGLPPLFPAAREEERDWFDEWMDAGGSEGTMPGE